MKIAVPTRDGYVDDHFGHCAYYTIFDVIDGKVTNISKMASPEGCGCKSGISTVRRVAPIRSARMTALFLVRSVVPKQGIVTAKISVLGRPRRSAVFAATKSASVESKPPEMPITIFFA